MRASLILQANRMKLKEAKKLKKIVRLSNVPAIQPLKDHLGQTLGLNYQLLTKLQRRFKRFRMGTTKPPVEHNMGWANIPDQVHQKTVECITMVAQFIAMRSLVTKVTSLREHGKTARDIYVKLMADPHDEQARFELLDFTMNIQAQAADHPKRARATEAAEEVQRQLAIAHIASLFYRVSKAIAQSEHTATLVRSKVGSFVHKRTLAERQKAKLLRQQQEQLAQLQEERDDEDKDEEDDKDEDEDEDDEDDDDEDWEEVDENEGWEWEHDEPPQKPQHPVSPHTGK